MQITTHRFQNHRFQFAQGALAPHKNLMLCVIVGRDAPVHVKLETMQLDARVASIKPNVTHSVVVHGGGADIYYFDGLCWPNETADAMALDSPWQDLKDAFDTSDQDRVAWFRSIIAGNPAPPDPSVMAIVHELYTKPLDRLSQNDLASRLGRERTQALRHFKATTGQTFRRFKIWAAMVAVVHRAHAGEQIGRAGVSAGFADAAHTARTAMQTFGLTPTSGISGLTNIQTVS